MTLRGVVMVTICALIFCAFWKIAEHLSADAIGMAVGMVFGVVFGIPVALLVLAGARRTDQEAPQAPPHTNVVVMLPPYDARECERVMDTQQQGRPALPDRYRIVTVTNRDEWMRGQP